MPHLRGSLNSPGNRGPIIDFYVGVSKPHADALAAQKLPVPPMVQISGLIDTGASCTCIDPQALSSLGLTATGSAPIQTPSTQGTPHICNQYDVSIRFPLPGMSYTIYAIPIIESELASQGIQALIGRDVLAKSVLVYDGVLGTFSIGF
ncbi:MAG TPA: hypothetical protein PK098_13570 [Phycisphaerales bacterium]|nr:hypothetical protein [Phycisphaerales bacterium]